MKEEFLRASTRPLSRPLTFLARLAYSSQFSLPVIVTAMFLYLGVRIEIGARVIDNTSNRQEEDVGVDVGDELPDLESNDGEEEEHQEGPRPGVVARVEVVRIWRGV